MTGLPVQKTILSNGIRVLSRKIKNVRSVTMGIWLTAGARDESDRESGLSHFIEHMIFKGTKRRTAFQIAREFDAIGGLTNAFTAMENTCFHAKVLDTHLATMVNILTDIFLNSTFDEKEVERERPVIFQEIGMVEDAPDEYVHQLNSATIWGNNPLGRSILGIRENILNFKSDAIRKFFNRLYQPDRIIIAAAGNLDHDTLLNLIGPEFEAVTAGAPLSPRKTPTPRSRLSVHEKDIEQTHLCLTMGGLPIADPDRYTLSVLNTILGGNMSSRLFQEIRERRGLAYSVYSYLNAYEDTGMVGTYAAVSPKETIRCARIILSELKRFQKEPVSDEELESAKDFTRGNLLLSSESVDNQMVRLAQSEIYFHRQIPMDDVLAAIDQVTPDDLIHLANRLFQMNCTTITALGKIDEPDRFHALLAQESDEI